MRENNQETKHIPTTGLAATFGVRPETIRRNLCVSGHFLGMKPIKLPNGRLLWPVVKPEDLVASRQEA